MAELTVDAAAMAAMAAAPLASMPEEAALQHMYAAPLMQSALQPNHLTANARRKPAKFVVQLYKMICEDPDLVRWHSGNIIMPNPTALKLKARGDRVLLFCQSTMMLDVLQVSPRPSPRMRLTGLDWT